MGLESPVIGNDVFTNTNVTLIKVKQDFTETRWNGMTIQRQDKRTATNQVFYFLDKDSGLFFVYGRGSMGDYFNETGVPYTSAPWKDDRKQFKHICYSVWSFYFFKLIVRTHFVTTNIHWNIVTIN